MRLTLLIGDLHVGRRTKTYDYMVFKERLDILYKNFIGFKKRINKSYAIKGFDVVLLGDLLDGEEIFRGHGYESEMMIDEAVQFVVDDLSLFMHDIFSRLSFKEVRIFGVPGNHGVANRGGSIGANWERMLYKIMSERFDYDIEIASEWYVPIEIGSGVKAIAMHGDNIKMVNQIPFYGINRNVLRWRAGGIMDSDFSYVFMGHFHVLASISCNDVRVYINGTMMDGDVYVERIGLKPDLAFWAILFDEDGTVMLETPLALDRVMFK